MTDETAALWKEIRKLQQRIHELENRQNPARWATPEEPSPRSYSPMDYIFPNRED